MSEQDDPITTALRDLASEATPPRLNPEALWRAGRRRHWAAITASAAGAAAAAALVPLAFLTAPSQHPAFAPPPAGSANHHQTPPIQFQQVARITHHQCPPYSHGLPGTSKNECFYLTHTGMTISRFASIAIINPPPGTSDYQLNVHLQRTDTHRFIGLTRQLANAPSPRNQLAIIANGVVLVHPTVLSAIDVGMFQLSAGHTRTQAEKLLHQLEHR